MAGVNLGKLCSLTGTRLVVWVNNQTLALSCDRNYDYGNVRRPWGTSNDFRSSFTMLQTNSAYNYPLLCSDADFTSGEEAYVSTSDSPPSVVRMKLKRMGAYRCNLVFPLLITKFGAVSIKAGQNAVEAMVKNQANLIGRGMDPSNPASLNVTNFDLGVDMIGIKDSYSMNCLPYVLEEFSISANGLGQASPVSCALRLVGIGAPFAVQQSDIMMQSPTRNPLGTNALTTANFSVDFGATTPTNDPTVATARVANIKDCSVNLLGLDAPLGTSDVQMVSLDLKVQQSTDLRSTAATSNTVVKTDINASSAYRTTYVNDDHIYVTQRTVSGSFSFLASSVVSSENLYDPAYFPLWVKGNKTSSLANGQWASPIVMSFGSMVFNIPACYWQPSSHKISQNSTLYTIKFLARTEDVWGRNEMKVSTPHVS